MPKVPLGINLIKDSTLVKKNKRLGKIRRKKEVLIIEPETASWIVLKDKELFLFNSLDKPMRVGEIKRNILSSVTHREKEEFLLKLYHRNMITLNGLSFYDPVELWKPPQRYPAFLCFHITEACNFACKYCYARADQKDAHKKVLPKEVAHKAVEKILEELPMENLLLDFHGGEPFLAFEARIDTRKYAHHYNKKRGINKNLSFVVQTNGSLLTVERAKTLKELGCNIGVSLDGPAFVHDAQRIWPNGKGTFNTVWKNVKEVIEAGINIGFLAVIHNPENYINTFKFFIEELNLQNFRINYSGYIGRATEELEFPYGRAKTFAYHYLKMVDAVIEHVKRTQKPLIIRDLDSQINNIVSKARPFMCYRSPCGCGNSILGFGQDGGIYACEEATGVEEFKIGNIFEDVSLTDVVDKSPVLKHINGRTVDNIPKCKNCLFKRFCGGRCTTKSFARYGNFRREDPMCRFYQIIYPELIWRIHDNPEIVPLLNPTLKGFMTLETHAPIYQL